MIKFTFILVTNSGYDWKALGLLTLAMQIYENTNLYKKNLLFAALTSILLGFLLQAVRMMKKKSTG